VRRAISVLLALAAALMVSLAMAGLVAFPVRAQSEGQIAYLGAGGSVWLSDVDSGETTQTADAHGFSTLDWSPDGQRLVLVKGGAGDQWSGEVYVLDPDAAALTKVGDGYAPVWSSDSKRILYVGDFTASEEGNEQNLRLFTLADGVDQVLATQRWVSGLWPIEAVRYSSDEELIAVYVAGLEMEGFIVIVDKNGGTVWEIPDFVYSADCFDWSPDDHRLAYRDSGDPFMGGEYPSLKIVRPENQEIVFSLDQGGFWPRWSPDGGSIAALLWEEGGGFRVMIADSSTGELALQSERVSGDLWESRPEWSPDGSSLLFTSTEGELTQVYAMDRTGVLLSIAQGRRPEARWSPDGTAIAVAMLEDGESEVLVANADGSGQRKVADGSNPRWRPPTEEERGGTQLCGLPMVGVSMILLLAFVGVRSRRSGRAGGVMA
jgi:dipeptidyl aminopeptidase/acylaminoacyl peptidase